MLRRVTLLLTCVLLLSVLWTAWQWLRPYQMGQASPWQVEEVSVRRDHGSVWVEVELKHRERLIGDEPPLCDLVDAQGTRMNPADARVSKDRKTCQIRFWLNANDLTREWSLQLQGENLLIKKSGGIVLENGHRRTYRQTQW